MCELASSGGESVAMKIEAGSPSSVSNGTPAFDTAIIVTSRSTNSVFACGIAMPYCIPVDIFSSRSTSAASTASRSAGGTIPRATTTSASSASTPCLSVAASDGTKNVCERNSEGLVLVSFTGASGRGAGPGVHGAENAAHSHKKRRNCPRKTCARGGMW